MRRKKEPKGLFALKKISLGIIVSVVVLTIIFVYNRNVLPGELFLYETIPYYQYNNNDVISKLFKFTPNNTEEVYAENELEGIEQNASTGETVANGVFSDKMEVDEDVVNVFVADETGQNEKELGELNKNIDQIEQDVAFEYNEIIGINSVLFQPEIETDQSITHNPDVIVPFDENSISDLDFLRKNFYAIDPKTDMTSTDFDGVRFIAENLKITASVNEPKVLIFHTHMYEGFIDSNPDDINDGVYGLGEELVSVLREKYSITAMHHAGRFDLVEGEVNITGAYERMEPVIIDVLQKHPSIEVVIDIHRDGVRDENTHLIAEVNGEPTAPIMFVNGLSKILQNGSLQAIQSLPNPNLPQNLAFSFQMQLAANKMFPGFARRIYLHAYRYSLNMRPKSLLVEIGAQTNTIREALNAIEPLADILANVIIE